MRFPKALLFLGVIALALLALSIVAGEASATDTTWTNAGGDGKASTVGNWDNGLDVGYNLIFDGTSTANCNFDTDIELGTLTIAAGYSGTITQSSDMHITGYSQAAGTFSGVNTKCVYCSGDFVQSAGTISPSVCRLMLTGSSLNVVGGTTFHTVYFNSSVTISHTSTSYVAVGGTIKINNDVIVTIATGKYFLLTTSTTENNGVITGGTVNFQTEYSDRTYLKLGTINSIINFQTGPSANANRKFTILNDLDCNLTVTVKSIPGTYTGTLDLNGHNLTASSITVGTRGILQCGEGTITTGSVDSSAGTITPETAQWIFDGAGNLKLKAGQSLYDAEFQGATTLLANAVISHYLSIPVGGSVVQGAFSLSVTSAIEHSADLYGTWTNVTVNGASTSNMIGVLSAMSGTVYFNETTAFCMPEDTLIITPDGWANVTILSWAAADLNAYGIFYLKGDAVANMTAGDGRYALWNGSASLGIFSPINGTIEATANASGGLPFTLNPCPVVTNPSDPQNADNLGDRYYWNVECNEEAMGVTYSLNCSNDEWLVINDSGEVQGPVDDVLEITVSVLIDDGYGGLTWHNWTVTVSVLAWNLHVSIYVEENGWNKVQYGFDFEGNMSLITKVRWNFGDGNGSKNIDPVHQYGAAGTYLVTVVLFDDFGNIGYTTREVTVGDPTIEDQHAAHLKWWFETQFIVLAGIIAGSIIIAGIYVYVADRHYGGANRLFPVAIIVLGVICALLYLREYGGF